MLFNSKVFVLFAAVVYPLYYALGERGKLWLLLVASYVFYGFWDPRLCSLIFLSTVVDFIAGGRIAATEHAPTRKRWLALSLVVNLGMLGFFKYYDFFVGELAFLLSALGFGVSADDWTLNLILPVGISFYTFQTMSYTIDLYRREIEPEPSLLRFAIYVAFFPQLVAGPVERAPHLLPQFQRPFRMSRAMVMEGVFLILLGFIKKTVIADRLARNIEPFYKELADSGPEAAMAMLAFTTQIYVDFSSYSDIAIGLGLLLGYNIRANFDLPFVVPSIPERWRRWHISMSHWFRDYIFIPLGGSRKGKWRTQLNIMIVMFLSGLWHGASNNFVVWGLLNGSTMVGHRLIKPYLRILSGLAEKNPVTERVYFYICCFVTYCMISTINIFFRCPDWETTKSFVRAIFLSGVTPYWDYLQAWSMPDSLWQCMWLTLVVFCGHEAQRYLQVKERVLGDVRGWLLVCVLMFWAVVTFGIAGPQFIYFQF
ncbi:MAG: MBOAT family protein [Alphaproteobacteria bacterium]|nr:MBOAT family protein [Alphaproteobacteria bacterium]MCB9794342.1 MBOAT family protein [Alphaproteobacteria bacterium]